MALATFANVLDTSTTTISFEISDDESDCDRSYSSVCSLLVIRKHAKGSNTAHGLPRRVAGSRRVSNYCDKNGSTPTTIPSANVQLLQSITAIPALADRSFEEIRLECYNQSMIATGKPPQAVNPSLNPSAVIPPLFMPVRDDNAEEPSLAITMLDV